MIEFVLYTYIIYSLSTLTFLVFSKPGYLVLHFPVLHFPVLHLFVPHFLSRIFGRFVSNDVLLLKGYTS